MRLSYVLIFAVYVQSVYGSYPAIRLADRFANFSSSLTVAAFAVYIQSAIRPVESMLSLSVWHPVCARLIANAQKNRLSFRTSGRINSTNCNQSVHSRLRLNTSGSRYPLGPALKRHILLSLSAFSAAGIIVP